MNPSKILPPVAVFLLLAFGGWRVSHYIASKHQQFQGRNLSQAHPLLSWLGPNQSVTQNGYTLVAIQDAGQTFQYQETNGGNNATYQDSGDANRRGDTAIWLLVMNLLANLQFDSSRDTGRTHAFTVSASLSTGETFPLEWEVSPSQPGPFLHATLPAGYPNTVQWVDVTVDDHRGNKAQWRISHLPSMLHLIAPPVQKQTSYKQNGAALTARAWRQRDPYNLSHSPIVMYRLRGAITPYLHQWEVAYLGCQWEWGASNIRPSNFIMSEGFDAKGEFDDESQPVTEGNAAPPFPYLSSNHYVRLFCQLRQFETDTETVTFRNVPLRRNKAGALFLAPPHPLSLKTPSGITVTLSDAATAASASANNFGNNSIGYVLDSDPQNVVASLSASPLWRKYRKPLTVSVSANPPQGYQQAGSQSSWQSGNKNVTIDFMRGPKPSSQVFATLPVAVQQRVDLQSLPMTFTVPIGEHP